MYIENIHPVLTQGLGRQEREERLQQKAKVFWLTGLSAAGKSTIAYGLEYKLFKAGFFPQVLDGDNVRVGLSRNLGFEMADRRENIRRIAEVAKLYTQSGIIVLCSFISPTRAIRQLAEDIIGQENFFEIFIDTPLDLCKKRDFKGLYAKAEKGEIKNFTGVDSPYEPPQQAFLTVTTANQSIKESIDFVFKKIEPIIVKSGEIINSEFVK